MDKIPMTRSGYAALERELGELKGYAIVSQ